MPKIIKEYSYEGPVYIIYPSGPNLHSRKWNGYTRASSPKKAITNLKDQYRKNYGLMRNIPLSLLEKNLREGDI